MFDSVRRVVTVIGEDGVSRIESDGPPPTVTRSETGTVLNEMWRIADVPADVHASGDLPFDFMSPPGGITVRRVDMPPDSMRYRDEQGRPRVPAFDEGMHQTASIDIITVLEGQLWLLLDSGEEVELGVGDTVIQRGTVHAWRNRTEQYTRYHAIMISAPLGHEITKHPPQKFSR